MNKHREAIEALEPFAKILDNLDTLAKSCSVSSTDQDNFTVTLKLSDLLEAFRVVDEWEDKHLNPICNNKPRCKTCGTRNHYENLDAEERCPFCHDEYKDFLLLREIEKVKERGGPRKNKKSSQSRIIDTRKEMASSLRELSAEELKEFLKSVPTENRVLYLGLLKKY